MRHLGRPAESQASLKRAMDLGLNPAEGRREFALSEAAKGFTPNAERNLIDTLRERPDDREILAALAAERGGSKHDDAGLAGPERTEGCAVALVATGLQRELS